MKIRDICEEFYGAAKSFSNDYDIYKNPESKELRKIQEIQPEARFIIDFKNKDVYIFTSNLLHYFAKKRVNIDYDDNNDFALGMGEMSRNKKINVYLNYLKTTKENINKIKNQEYDWLNKYFIFID